MKTMRFCALSVLLSMAAHGGISDALSAAAPPPPQAPASPSSAANPPSLDRPAGGGVRDTPVGGPGNPNTTPMPAPAATDNYASSR